MQQPISTSAVTISDDDRTNAPAQNTCDSEKVRVHLVSCDVSMEVEIATSKRRPIREASEEHIGITFAFFTPHSPLPPQFRP